MIRDDRIVKLAVRFWIVAVVALTVGAGALPSVVANVAIFFYQPRALAIVHVFALGWITAAMMGVMYRYVPALTKGRLPFPALGELQFVLFLVGATGMVAYFSAGNWTGTALAAAVMAASVALFAANMLACLAPSWKKGVTERGLTFAVVFLLAASALGLVLAFDKRFGLLGGNPLRNLAAHAHLAALGWVTLTICAVSYRMLPAFLLPQADLPRAAGWQIDTLAAALAALSASLLGRMGGAGLWATAIVVNLLAYLWIVASMVGSRRMPIDWTLRHVLAGSSWLLVALVLGAALAGVGGGSERGNRIAVAYGSTALLGWVSNLILGMSYRLVPGLVVGARAAARLPLLPQSEISAVRSRPLVFAIWNGGLALFVGGILGGTVPVASMGAWALAVGGLAYCGPMGRTLSFAWRKSAPV
jgi:hypothetical protein